MKSRFNPLHAVLLLRRCLWSWRNHTARLKKPSTTGHGAGPSGSWLTWLATNQSTQLEYATNLPAVWEGCNGVAGAQRLAVRGRWTNAVPRVFFRLRRGEQGCGQAGVVCGSEPFTSTMRRGESCGWARGARLSKTGPDHESASWRRSGWSFRARGTRPSPRFRPDYALTLPPIRVIGCAVPTASSAAGEIAVTRCKPRDSI